MADLGAIELRPSFPPARAELLPISHYRVVRGKFLGSIAERDPSLPFPVWNSNLGGYVVRQIRILYRQLWPSHGQRFPQ